MSKKIRMDVMGRKKKHELFTLAHKLMAEWRTTDDELFRLVDEGKVKSGALIVHLSYENYGWKLIDRAYNASLDGKVENHWQGITGRNLKYAIDQIKEGMAQAKEFVEAHR